jgi:phosphohistidine phosphatase
MKTLILLRHAKSGWNDPALRDFDRPLNPRGRRAAKVVGREIKALGMSFDRVLASPAARVIETISELESGLGSKLAPVFDERLYLASTATLLAAIHETPETVEHLLLIGHNPGLEELALLLSGTNDEQLRQEVAIKYPTATLAELSLDTTAWGNVGEASATLTRFIRPRDLDPSLGPDEDSY